MITSLVVPEEVTVIKNNTFREISLSEVTIHDGVTRINCTAFNGSGLVNIRIPDLAAWCSIKFEDERGGGSFLYDAILEGRNLYVNDQLLTTLIIPEGVTSVNNYAFKEYDNLTSVVIPDHVVQIGRYVFSSCDNLSKVSIGKGITEIGSSAFSYIPLKECWIYAVTPPSADHAFSSTNYKECTLYVPKGCAQAYIDEGWNEDFYNIVEMGE